MRAEMLSMNDFTTSTHDALVELFFELASERKRQLERHYLVVLAEYMFIGSQPVELHERIAELVRREVKFIVTAAASEAALLNKDWDDLHAEIILDLKEVEPWRSWDGHKDRFDLISVAAWAHRACWVQQRDTLQKSLRECRLLIARNKPHEAYALRDEVLRMLDGTARTMIADSLLT